MNLKAAPVSVCIIARNEQAIISRCLDSVVPLTAEVIVVDTGSSDDTPAIARRLGARVEHYAWCDDFSAARNYALGLARQPWILVLDADEMLAPCSEGLLCKLTRQSEGLSYRCTICNALPDSREFLSYAVRLFRNDPRIRFAGRAHEHVNDALARIGHPAASCDLTIFHSGYGVDVHTNRAKAERNLKGLRLDFEAAPQNHFLALKIGQLYATLDDADTALPYLQRGTAASDPALVAEAYNSIASIHIARQQIEPALRACAESISLIPYQRMAYGLISECLRATGYHDDAAAQLAVARSMTGLTQLQSDLPALVG